MRHSLLLCGLVVAGSAAAGDAEDISLTLEVVAERLSKPVVLRGNYTQTRQIAVLSRPLASSGRFLLSERGLQWQQEEPFDNVIVADGERVAERMADGPVKSTDGSRQPMVVAISRIFLDMFRGRHKDLDDNFAVRFEQDNEAWEIGLTPTSSPLSAAIRQIILKGREHIDQISVFSGASDEMTIRFFDLQTLPEQLSDHEIELYAW
jgi:hypothetical protein